MSAPAIDERVVAQGKTHYTRRGCRSCHATSAAQKREENGDEHHGYAEPKRSPHHRLPPADAVEKKGGVQRSDEKPVDVSCRAV